MDEAERREQLADILNRRLSPDEITHLDMSRFNNEVQIYVDVEIELERQLRMEGYLPDTINNRRAKIRDIAFYTKKGHLIKEKTLMEYRCPRKMAG